MLDIRKMDSEDTQHGYHQEEIGGQEEGHP